MRNFGARSTPWLWLFEDKIRSRWSPENFCNFLFSLCDTQNLELLLHITAGVTGFWKKYQRGIKKFFDLLKIATFHLGLQVNLYNKITHPEANFMKLHRRSLRALLLNFYLSICCKLHHSKKNFLAVLLSSSNLPLVAMYFNILSKSIADNLFVNQKKKRKLPSGSSERNRSVTTTTIRLNILGQATLI